MSGPPMSNTWPAVAGISMQPIRYASTLRMAIGWVRLETQRGQTMAGSRETSERSISNDALPEPMIIAARSSVVGTGPARSTSPTSWRLERCVESCSDRRPRPPR